MLRQLSLFRNMSDVQALAYEVIVGSLRMLFLIFSCLMFATMCAGWLEGVDVWSIAVQLKQNARPLFTWVPTFVWVFRVPFQDWHTARYLLAPLGAFLLVFIGSILYVRDIYHLPTLGRAFHYVFASMFGFFYPVAHVDGGRIDDEDPDDENHIEDRNLLRAIGGPGFVSVQPGNAVAFRDWQGARGIETNRLYFMRPFEMIAKVVNLEDQHGHIDELPVTTGDGIRVRLKNIDYRFCVLRPAQKMHDLPKNKKGERSQAIQRNQASPYPFDANAITSIAYSFSASDRGTDRWPEVVAREVGGAVSNFVSTHDLDYLTAPRQDGQNPRRELRVELFAPAVSGSLRRWGAELHWMDIGHFDIDDLEPDGQQDPVDQARTKFWAARWVGDAKTVRSYGEAKHIAYQELARAEAQAEMIMSITDALRNVNFGADRAETLRQIFLARTAQILEALQNRGQGTELPK
jgi:hypothetical protein